MKKIVPLVGVMILLISCSPTDQHLTNSVVVIGQMNNVMWKGQLEGKVDLDTIAGKTNLYGLGPVDYLSGELLVLEGKSYLATVTSDTTMKVEETYHVMAPFFAYANISKWTEHVLPDSIQTIRQLEAFLDQLRGPLPQPFLFKLKGTVEQAGIHVVNLPKGSQVKSPDDSHTGQRSYDLHSEPSEILGFFSRNHKGIFTHHDTFVHMHLITDDLTKMGHLDAVKFKRGSVKLFLPE